METRCLLATFNVNSVGDNSVVDDTTTLREAVDAANASGGADLIRFDPTVFPRDEPSRITLTQGAISITSEMTIYGSGVGLVESPGDANLRIEEDLLVVSGNNGGSVFNVGPGANVLITGMRIVEATTSAIVNAGHLTLDGVRLTGNSATTGITGGGIRNTSILAVNNSTIFGNSADAGGGIHSVGGTVFISNSAVSNNRATASNGGGVYSESGTLRIVNSTLSNNRASQNGGGVWDFNAAFLTTLTNTTITGNTGNTGGGIGASNDQFIRVVQLQNTIVAGNSRSNEVSDDISALTNSAIDVDGSSHNLIGDPNSAGGFVHGANNNIVGDGSGQALPVDSILDTQLQPFSGMKFGHPLVTNSPAIDSGNNALALDVNGVPLRFDQRDFPLLRVVDHVGPTDFDEVRFDLLPNPIVDRGALELQPTPVAGSQASIVVSTLLDGSDGDHSFGNLSLREAVEIANRRPDRNTITFDPNLSGTIALTQGELVFQWDLNLTGPSPQVLVIDAGDLSRHFTITEGRRARISGMTLIGGQTNARAGSILNQGVTTLNNMLFNDNEARGGTSFDGGGAIVNTGAGASMTLREVTLFDNIATAMRGGGILNEATMHLKLGTRITSNLAGDGAGLFNAGTLTVEDTVFDNNLAEKTGGGVGDGGAIAAVGGTITIHRSQILANLAERLGGGISSFQGDLTIVDTTISSNVNRTSDANVSVTFGGGIYADTSSGRSLLVHRSTIDNNQAHLGGGIYLKQEGFGEKLILNSTLSSNLAVQGGGLFLADITTSSQPLSINETTIASNTVEVIDQIDVSLVFAAGAFIGDDVGTLKNTIIGDNQRVTGLLRFNQDLTQTDSGFINVAEYNVIETYNGRADSRFTASIIPALPNSSNNVIADPMLEPLAANGGQTRTHKLKLDSPAIDRGEPYGLGVSFVGFELLDQNGQLVTDIPGKPAAGVGSPIDIGSYELQQINFQSWESFVESASQFSPGTGQAEFGFGFDTGKPGNIVPRDPLFLGIDFDPGPVTLGAIGSSGFVDGAINKTGNFFKCTVGGGLKRLFGGGGGCKKIDVSARFGARVTVDLDVRLGVEVGFYVNKGSVDVRYQGDASFDVQQTALNTFTVNTGVNIKDGSLYTISPRFGAYIDLVVEFAMVISGEGCFGPCGRGTLGPINVNERIPLLSINRPKQDTGDIDGDGNKYEQLLKDPNTGVETVRSGPNDFRELQMQLDGAIKLGGINIAGLLSGGFANPLDKIQEGQEERSDAEADEREAEKDKAKGKQPELGEKTPDERINDAREKKKTANKKIDDASKKKPGTSKVDGAKNGFGLVFGVAPFEDSLLGLELSVGAGAGIQGVSLEKTMGKLSFTVPDVQLIDTQPDPRGRLEESTRNFDPDSEEEKKRQISKLTIDVAGVLTPLLISVPVLGQIVGAIGEFNVSAGPVSLSATTLQYRIETTLGLTQDVDVTPYFDQNHPMTFQFVDPASGTPVNVADVRVDGFSLGSLNAVQFLPWQTVEVTTFGNPVGVRPSFRLGNRFHNRLGLDVKAEGIFEGLKIALRAFGKTLFDKGPLIGPYTHNIGQFDLGNIINRTFDLATPLTNLNTFTLGGLSSGDGSAPGNAVAVSPGVPFFPADSDRANFVAIPLLDRQSGAPVDRVDFASTGGNQVVIVLQKGLRGTFGTTEVNLVPGQPHHFSSANWSIHGFDPRAFSGNAVVQWIFTSGGSLTATPAVIPSPEPVPLFSLNEALLNDANAAFVEDDLALDIDGNGKVDVESDGTLIANYMEGKQGDELIRNAIGPNATRTDPGAISSWLDELTAFRAPDGTFVNRLDADGDGQVEWESDGKVILRNMAGYDGSATVDGLSLNGPRSDPDELSSYVAGEQISDGIDTKFTSFDFADRTGGDAFGTNAAFAVSPEAIPGSSPWAPLIPQQTGDIYTVELSGYGAITQYVDTYLADEGDPNSRTLISTKAVGTPERVVGTDTVEDIETQQQYETYLRRLQHGTRSSQLGVDEPIYIQLPDSAGYEFTIPNGFNFQGLQFDATEGNGRLNHPGAEVDFDVHLPDSNQWFSISMDEPFSFPAGTDKFQLYPRTLPNPEFHQDSNRGQSDIDMSVGLLISGAGATPNVTASLLSVRGNVFQPNPVSYSPLFFSEAEFLLRRSGHSVNVFFNNVFETSFTQASLTDIPVLGTATVGDKLVIDSSDGPLFAPISYFGGVDFNARDSLVLNGQSGVVDITTRYLLSSVEVVDIRGTGANELVLDFDSVSFNASDEGGLVVVADNDDIVTFREGNSWARGATTPITGFSFPFDIYELNGVFVFLGRDPVGPGPSAPPQTSPNSAIERPAYSAPPQSAAGAPVPTQLVTAFPRTQLAEFGAATTIDVFYEVQNQLGDEPNNLQFQIHYDSRLLQFDNLVNHIGDGFEGIQDKEEDIPDGNPLTDRMIVCLWFDLNGWLTDLNGPTKLVTLNFTALEGKQATTAVEFTGNGTLGYEFVTEAAGVEILPQSFVVDNIVDEDDGDFSFGDLSLREAVRRANADPGPAIIRFDPSLSNTISLDGTPLGIDDDVTIQGLGANQLAIDGGNLSRIFTIGPGVTAELSGLALQNGSAVNGGAILNDGTLLIRDLAIVRNAAQNGGGIVNNGTLTIQNSELSENVVSGDGGAIHNSAVLTIANSTISSNRASDRGAGLFTQGGTTTSRNNTVTANRSNSDGINLTSGGGVHLSGLAAVSMFNSIVVGNSSGVPGAATSSDLDGTLDLTSSNNLIGNPAAQVIEPTLAFNGGPTRTHNLVANSLAKDGGGNGLAQDEDGFQLVTDQSGQVRIFGTAVDIGAVEAAPTPGVIVSETDGATAVSETGTSDFISISLAAPPATNVVVTLSSSDEQEVRVGIDSVIFSQANWNVPQTVPLTGVADGTGDGDQSIAVTISINTLVSDNAFAALADRTLNVTVVDIDGGPTVPTVTVQASDAIGAEQGLDPAAFTVTRDIVTSNSLDVSLLIGGSATNAEDFDQIASSIRIPPNAASVTIFVTPKEDGDVEGTETVQLFLVADSAYIIGTANSATVSIEDNDVVQPPTVSIQATDPNSSEENLDPGTFTITRSIVSSTPLDVSYLIAGTATNSVDYEQIASSARIPANLASTTVTVLPKQDGDVEGTETIELTLIDGSTYDVDSFADDATVNLADDDSSGPTDLVATSFTTGASAADTVLNYNVTGTAALAFEVGFFASTDTQLGVSDVEVGSRINVVSPADLSVGSHSLDVDQREIDTMLGNFKTRFVLAVIDPDNRTLESDLSNNVQNYVGFFHQVGSSTAIRGVHNVGPNPGDPNDNISISAGFFNTQFGVNGRVFDVASAEITRIVVLTEGGDDTVSATDSVLSALAVKAGAGVDSVRGGGGGDVLIGQGDGDSVVGGAGKDRMQGGKGNDRMDGDAGDDIINGGKGDDIVLGNIGNDRLVGSTGNDNLSGGDGNDSLNGKSGEDTLLGNRGDDRLLGGTQSDELDGGEGNDVLMGMTHVLQDDRESDLMFGGTGIDRTIGFLDPFDLLTSVEKDRRRP